MKAPRPMENPAAALATPEPTTTKRQAAMNNSVDCAAATNRNNGRSNSRPPRISAPSTTRAGRKVQKMATPVRPALASASTVTKNSNGATIRSCVNKTAKAARPGVLLR